MCGDVNLFVCRLLLQKYDVKVPRFEVKDYSCTAWKNAQPQITILTHSSTRYNGFLTLVLIVLFHFDSLIGYSLRETECDFLHTEDLLSIFGFSSAQGTRRPTKERNSK